MEADWRADRARLRELYQENNHRGIRDFATTLKRSVGWVVKWLKRFRADPDADDSVLDRQRSQASSCLSQPVMTTILDIRDNPPDNLQRTPGPKAILYYLSKDPNLEGEYLPGAASTVYRVLKEAGRILTRGRLREPLERPDPMTLWELDFTDVGTVVPDPEGKKAHAVETLNVVDAGTSILVGCTSREDFNAETALLEGVELVKRAGVVAAVRIDRDPRFVGCPQQGDFPSAFVRFWLCLGVRVIICDPRRPQDKPFVERLNGTYQREFVEVKRPTTLAETQEGNKQFEQHYNEERPHQGTACNNQAPAQALAPHALAVQRIGNTIL